MKTIKLCLMCMAVAMVAHAISQQTPAQFMDSMGTGWNNAMSASASTMVWNSIFYRTTGASKGGTRTSTATKTSPQSAQPVKTVPNLVKAGNSNVVKFHPVGTYIKTRELADSLGNTPTEREQYQKLMNAVLDAFGQKANAAGFPNDLAAALAFFLGENIRIYRGIPDFADQQYIDLRNAIADALASSGAIDSLTDRQKQEMYETLVAYTGITQYGYEQGLQAQNDAIIKGYQKVAGQNLQTVTKMSPDNINFGPSGLSAGGDGSPASGSINGTSPRVTSSDPIDIGKLRQDYSDNEVRADQIYKGKRFLFTGKVVELSSVHYKTTGQDETGRYIYTNVGTNLKVSNTGGGTVFGWNVYCFFKDNNQLAQVHGQQIVTFEAKVQGSEDGSNSLILVDAVLR